MPFKIKVIVNRTRCYGFLRNDQQQFLQSGLKSALDIQSCSLNLPGNKRQAAGQIQIMQGIAERCRNRSLQKGLHIGNIHSISANPDLIDRLLLFYADRSAHPQGFPWTHSEGQVVGHIHSEGKAAMKRTWIQCPSRIPRVVVSVIIESKL